MSERAFVCQLTLLNIDTYSNILIESLINTNEMYSRVNEILIYVIDITFGINESIFLVMNNKRCTFFSSSSRLKMYKYIYNNGAHLHLTITFIVSFTGSPTPLKAVLRYVPLKFLFISAITKYPSLDCSAPLSAPFSHTLVQVIFGSGLPVALQPKVTSECSQTSWSLVTATIWGRSTNNCVITADWD